MHVVLLTPPPTDASRELGFRMLDLISEPVNEIGNDQFDNPGRISSYATYLAGFQEIEASYRAAIADVIDGARALDRGYTEVADLAAAAVDGWITFLRKLSTDTTERTAAELGRDLAQPLNDAADALLAFASTLAPPPDSNA